MVYARLRVELPKTLWVTRLSEAQPEATMTALSAVAVDDDVVTLLDVEDCNPEAVRTTGSDDPEVDAFEVVVEADDRIVVSYQIRARLYRAAERAGVPPPYPVEIRDGCARLELTTSRAALTTLVHELETAGGTVDVRALSMDDNGPSVLTERQRAVLEAAYERGYYDSPRRCSTAELAASFDVVPSTVSEILRRAERRALGRLLEEP